MYGESGHLSAAYNFRSTSLRILTSSYRAGVSCPGTSSHHSKENTMADDDCDDITALLLALTTIAQETTDVDSARLSMIALYETTIGRQFLANNPIEVQ